MITKERLEELIEQMADIFVVMHFGVYTHKLTREYKLGDYGVGVVKYGKVNERWTYEDLFETKEDAEEYAEFGNITRTERLELPSWEDINKENCCCIEFFSKNNIRCWLALDMPYKNDIGIISVAHSMNEMSVENIFVERFTRENYNEARRLCVKLFKGEDV